LPEICDQSSMDQLFKLALKDKEIEENAKETPNAANQVQYPDEFNNWVPVITAAPMQQAKVATIIIATESKGYPEESFNTDVATTLSYFKIDPEDQFMYQAILLKPATEKVLDSADARKKLKKVVDLMNRSTVLYAGEIDESSQSDLDPSGTLNSRLQGEVTITTHSKYILRIVSFGVAAPHAFIFEAMEYLLNHWKVPCKYVQFVTNGEMKAKGELLDFWTSACVNQLVQQVQFVNLSRYLPFGYYKGNCKRMNKSRPVLTDSPSRGTEHMPAITD